MRPFSSSISSSERRHGLRARGRWQPLARTLGWTVVALIALDVLIGRMTAMPHNPAQAPNTLQQYFDYGRSTEAKMRRMVGPAHGIAPIAQAGWLDDCTKRQAAREMIDVYGNSFSVHIAEAMGKQEPLLRARGFAGPGAPPNHSFACYQRARAAGIARGKVQIWGILAGSLKGMLTYTGATTTFERPFPFTFPRYFLGPRGQLLSVQPVYGSERDFRRSLADQALWQRYVTQLREGDRFYDARLFDASFIDHSTLARLLRRGYGQNALKQRTTAALLDAGPEFGEHKEIGPVLRAMVSEFARSVRANHQVPVVLLFQNRPYGDALERLLGDTLRRERIPFISSRAYAPTTDPSKFISDGHFTPAVDAAMAKDVLALIRPHLELPTRGETTGTDTARRDAQ